MSNGSLTTGVPLSSPLVDTASGNATKTWQSFFISLWQRTGGANLDASPILDEVTNLPGSLLYRGPTAWVGLASSAQYRVLREGANFPEWDLVDGNSFAQQPPNAFFSGPVSGGATNPSFRTLATNDMATVAGAFPGTSQAALASAGNVGEYISSTVLPGSSIALTSTTIADITHIVLTPGDWDVRGWLGLAGTGTVSGANAWVNSSSAADPGAPNGGAYLSSPNGFSAPIGTVRAGLSANTSFYLSTKAVCTGTISAYGFIGARRVR